MVSLKFIHSYNNISNTIVKFLQPHLKQQSQVDNCDS